MLGEDTTPPPLQVEKTFGTQRAVGESRTSERVRLKALTSTVSGTSTRSEDGTGDLNTNTR